MFPFFASLRILCPPELLKVMHRYDFTKSFVLLLHLNFDQQRIDPRIVLVGYLFGYTGDDTKSDKK
jgi:hypothetical protein